jgi:prevent-host-death family protein
MTKSVGVHQAKTHLSRLLRDVAEGEQVVITSRGKPVAVLGPAADDRVPRFGIDRGRFEVPDDFNAPLPDDLLDEFEN